MSSMRRPRRERALRDRRRQILPLEVGRSSDRALRPRHRPAPSAVSWGPSATPPKISPREAAVASVLPKLSRTCARARVLGENEGPKSPGATKEALDDRERECCGLAGTCLGQPNQVSPLEGERDCLQLNRRRLPVPARRMASISSGARAEQLEAGSVSIVVCMSPTAPGPLDSVVRFPRTGAPSAAPFGRAPDGIFGRAAKCALFSEPMSRRLESAPRATLRAPRASK